MRSSRGKFFFVILSVAIGVAALTGVRGFSSSFRTTLLERARSILAADLSARTTMQPTANEVAGLKQVQSEGMQMTTVTELLSMVSAARTLDPLLVSLKAVDPKDYPYYGSVELDPAGSLKSVLDDNSAVVADDLLVRLKLHVGDQLKIGNKLFRISAVVVNEPDRLSGSFSPGPRVLISRQGLEESGLLAPGSHAGQRYLFKVPAPAGQPVSDKSVGELKARLIKLLPEAQVTDYRETNPALTDGLDRATSMLSLMSLVALVLGAVGVAMAMRAHLQQRLDTIAIMKSLGAGSGQIIKIYLIQTLLLGAVGGVLGVAMGVGVQLAFPYLLKSLINVVPDLHIDPRAILAGLGAGMLTTLLFTLPPLLDIRGIRPILILRRAVDEYEEPEPETLRQRLRKTLPGMALVFCLLLALDGLLRLAHMGTSVFTLRRLALILPGELLLAVLTGWFMPPLNQVLLRLKKNSAQIFAFALILGGLAFIASRVSDSRAVGKYFSFGLCAVLAVLLGASFLVLKGLKYFLSRTRLHLPSVLRHGLANLYRPGNPSAALLAALGMGVMQIMLVFLMQHAVVEQLQITSAPNLPNVFLIDIANDEIDGMRKLLKDSPAVTGTPEMLPVVSSRILALNGVSANSIKTRNFPHRMLQSISLTWSDGVPPGATLVDGKWWSKAQAADAAVHPVVAVAKVQADRLGIGIGSTVSFAAQDKRFDATVVALTRADGQHAFSRAEFILPEKSLAGLPIIWYGGVHAVPARVGELQRALYAAYPTVTVINVAQALETIRGVVVQIIYVVQFLAAFSIFAGIVILASSIAGTRYRRIREVVVLKTLGATRARIASIFSIEFAVLGLVAGLVGVFFANVIVRALLRVLTIPAHVEWGWSLLGILVTGALTVATGWMASHRILGQKPLEVLREE